MRLTIAPLTATMTAFTIPQKFGAASQGSAIGTRNLSNCLGVAIYNRIGHAGVIAHIEAEDAGIYDRVANAAVATMLATLNAHGGDSGSLCLVLLGNAGAHKVTIDHKPFGFRLAPPDYADLRGQLYGAFVLDPAHEILYTDAAGDHIADGAAAHDVVTFAV